ncbi:hypothetical protein HNR36_001069 [Ureibacillus thermosphaericus]|uniref:Uncharacterized protein n=1 Tax=Ureibacillus thermosphaericus TaxID=51173 RepID=A0A840PRQ6_URETH|nr:hypothetical protein [Ureibacillus thermosphaericus]
MKLTQVEDKNNFAIDEIDLEGWLWLENMI